MLISVAASVAALGTALGTALVAAPPAGAAVPAAAMAATATGTGTATAQNEIRVVSWNICGEAGSPRGVAGFCPYRNEPTVKMDEVKKVVDERRANVVMLQEVCGGAPGSHMALLQERLGSEWSIRHAKGARPDGRTDCRGGLTGELGILLAVKGTVTGSWSENTLPASPEDSQTLPALCVAVEGWSTTPCTTHVIPGQASRAAEQIKNVKAFLDAHAPGGTVLGGDFNRNAGAAEMATLTGAYDNCIEGYTYHGWDTEGTGGHSWNKLDHLFTTKAVGASRFASCAIDSARMDTTPNEPDSGAPSGVSDHAPVTAVLRGAPRAGDMNGDGKSDLVAVDDAGKLRLYAGHGNGAVTGSPAEIGSGGWAGASVSHRGDWTGDGTEDLVARVGGELRVYPNRGDGTLASPVRIGTGFPADSRVVSVGDATGDGYPDVVATIGDTLWLYAGDPGAAAGAGVKSGVQIGLRGWSPMSLSAAGDADHDGRVDLFARDANDEKLWLYRGRGDGTFGERTEYGHGYGTGNRPLLAGAGDADGNGVADLWATTNEGTGTLLFYAGETNGAGNPVDGPRTTVGLSGWNTIRAIG